MAVPTESERLQRPTRDLPVLHLEAEIPRRARWELRIDGLVAAPAAWRLEDLQAMPAEERVWDLHCVWGWTRPACRWRGIPAGHVLELSGPEPRAAHVVVQAVESPYASCLTIEEACEGLLAWELDGEDLPPEHGGPLRFVPPPTKWGYKGVKWVGRLTLVRRFSPGFWEALTGNPRGDVPLHRLDLRHE